MTTFEKMTPDFHEKTELRFTVSSLMSTSFDNDQQKWHRFH